MTLFDAIIVVLVILVVWYVLSGGKHKHRNTRYTSSRSANVDLSTIDGNDTTEDVLRTLAILDAKPAPSALDHYQLGTFYDYHLGDQQKAQKHYTRALEKATIEPKDITFIVDRIGDRLVQERPPEYDEHHYDFNVAVQLQQAFDVAAANRQIPAENDWHIDTQNVHDSILNNKVGEHYKRLKGINSPEPVNIDTIIQNLSADPKAFEFNNAIKMLQYIKEHNAHIVKLDNDTEPQFVCEVWKQASRRPTAKTSFIESLDESWNKGIPTCATGRVARVLQSQAHTIPEDPTIGVLKTREAIRNEIFNSSSHMLSQGLAKNEQVRTLIDKETLTRDEQITVDTFKNGLKQEISKMVNGYTELTSPDKDTVIQECFIAIDP